MNSSARPNISFVMATRNRGEVVVDCLRRILACGLPQSQFDIRVVDNASTDGTPGLVANLAREHSNLHVTRLEKNCGPVAKNIAIDNNPAEIIILLDDDAYPLPDAVTQMIRHFHDDPRLGAAVFDVTLPNGAKEASAYPDVFIGAGTALRGEALRMLQDSPAARRPGRGLLPADFFMQAEEYDLSFRLLAAGWSVQRFWDMPLMHLKTPGARIGQRTTRLDIRNNLWLLARYVPEPLAQEFAAEWLARYWRMAVLRDQSAPAGERSHRAAYLRGAAEGFSHWKQQRGHGELILNNSTLERIFRFEAIRTRLARLKDQHGLSAIALGDWGKNILPYHQAARELGLRITAVVDHRLASGEEDVDYRGIRVIADGHFREDYQHQTDAVILTTMSPIHAARRAGELGRILSIPVLDVFAPARKMSVTPVESQTSP